MSPRLARASSDADGVVPVIETTSFWPTSCSSVGSAAGRARSALPASRRRRRAGRSGWRACSGSIHESASSRGVPCRCGRGTQPDEGLRGQACRRRPHLQRRARHRDRLPRAERLRQVDDDAPDPRPRRAHRGRRDRQRQALPRPPGAVARGRRASGGPLRAHGPLGLPPPARPRADPRHPEAPRPRADRPRRPARGRRQARRPVLPGDGPAARDRHRAPRRPVHAAPGRAGQRSRPRGHPLDPQPAQGPRRRGPHRLRLVAPDGRDGADGRPPDRDRARQADRRHERRGLRRARLRQGRARPLARASAPARGARATGRHLRGRRARQPRGARADDRAGRRRRRRSTASRSTS